MSLRFKDPSSLEYFLFLDLVGELFEGRIAMVASEQYFEIGGREFGGAIEIVGRLDFLELKMGKGGMSFLDSLDVVAHIR